MAEGEGDGDEEEMADVDEEEEAARGARDITMAEIETVTWTATDIETETETEPWLPMIRVILHNYARSYKWTIVALATGDERRADVVRLQEPLSETGGFGISHSADEIKKQKEFGRRYGEGVAWWLMSGRI
jgi:hypothetical protein